MEKIFYFKNDIKPMIEYIKQTLTWIICVDVNRWERKLNTTGVDDRSLFRCGIFYKAFNEYFADEGLEYTTFDYETYKPLFSRNGIEISTEELSQFELNVFFKGIYILSQMEDSFYSIVIIDELMPTNKDKLTKYYNDILDFALSKNGYNATFFIGKNLVSIA